MGKLKTISTFRAFHNPNYALYFAGQSVSQIGTWMQRTGVSWVVYTMTHSTVMLGLTVFASQFPSFVLSLFGGLVSDRYNRYRILLVTQVASMVQAILLAVLVLTNHHTVPLILSLSVLLGIINAFDVPARQPLVHDLVRNPADIANAVALNSSMVNLARLLGPALSGIILQRFGAGTCFLINAVSFVAVIASLLLMKLEPRAAAPPKGRVGAQLAEGFRYLKNTPSIGVVILMLGLMSLMVLPYNTLLPVFAKVIFKGDAATFGYINSFIGLGAITGTFFLASLKGGTDLKKVLLVNTLVFGTGLIVFSQLRSFPAAMIFATVSGFGAMSQTTICNTIVQVEADARVRGRVISYVAMAFFGMLPLGSLVVGIVSQHIGAPLTMLSQGIIALLVAGVFARFLRRAGLKRNIVSGIPEQPIHSAAS